METHRVDVWLNDIRSEIAAIQALTRGETADTLAASWAMTRAVQHALLIIAEAAKHVPEDLKADRPEVPWGKIHGLGNLLRHEYRRIDPSILWSVIVDHLETLDQAAKALLEDRKSD